MATMAINNKYLKKSIFFRTRRPMILKLGMKHQGMEVYKICINHVPGMTLTYFTAKQLRSPSMHFEWGKLLKCHSKGNTCSKFANGLNFHDLKNQQMDRRFMLKIIFLGPGGCLPLSQGYINVYDQTIRTSSSLKPLGQSKPNFMWSILRKSE